jgi:uncharacterized protein DUF5681
MSAAHRTSEGRFAPGRSGNPAGRPRGSRNKATLAAEAMLHTHAELLTNMLTASASAGKAAALRLCFDCLAPRRKGRPVPFALPRLESLADAVDAAAAIVAGAAAGELTPLEAGELIKVVEVFMRAAADVELRLGTLETDAVGGTGAARPASGSCK